ncbi:unnamed protein product [Amaranthus hypochondriacus]
MPIEMPRGLPFSVDTWNPNSKLKHHHFLTHAHKDHCSGITSHSSYPIYATHLTKSLVLIFFPQIDESMFVEIEVGQTITVNDPDGCFSVTAFDANHCPGAVMFLFEGKFGNILHTGDCRLTPECLQNLPEKYIARKGKEPNCRLDFVFLDCTFGKSLMNIPSKHSAMKQIINCIWKHPDVPTVYLTCSILGQEEVLKEVFQTFGSKIYVDKAKHPDFHKALELISPQILSEDPSSRFHLFDGYPKLYEKAKKKILQARENMQPEPLILRPSAQWYACKETELTVMERKILERSNIPIKDQFGVWHVCYSTHSSRQELEWALELLSPKWVVSTTPECRAMELDYIKKYCNSSARASDDRFWKVLDMSMETSLRVTSDVNVKSKADCEKPELLQLPMILPNQESLLELPSSKKRQVTLFGRARLGYHSCMSAEERKNMRLKSEELDLRNMLYSDDGEIKDRANENGLGVDLISSDDKECKDENAGYDIKENDIEVKLPSFDDDTKSIAKNDNENNTEVVTADIALDKLRTDATVRKSASFSYVGSSNRFSENVRKFYRSMNVPVPEPLPSLVRLMKSIKSSKRKYEI